MASVFGPPQALKQADVDKLGLTDLKTKLSSYVTQSRNSKGKEKNIADKNVEMLEAAIARKNAASGANPSSPPVTPQVAPRQQPSSPPPAPSKRPPPVRTAPQNTDIVRVEDPETPDPETPLPVRNGVATPVTSRPTLPVSGTTRGDNLVCDPAAAGLQEDLTKSTEEAAGLKERLAEQTAFSETIQRRVQQMVSSLASTTSALKDAKTQLAAAQSDLQSKSGSHADSLAASTAAVDAAQQHVKLCGQVIFSLAKLTSGLNNSISALGNEIDQLTTIQAGTKAELDKVVPEEETEAAAA
jgi:hypothetical protein